ncbi:MAG TPA: class I SAM-dependent methyltransferase [Ornithinibacter sp.]|nr:class I SAM-dependent methyltransferase [Ornithinibacter sp.]
MADRDLVAQRLRQARSEAFPPGEFVGQESFVTAGEVLLLGRQAGIAPGVSVLDLCCGESGPGLHLTRELGCTYLGVDASPDSVARARRRSADQGLQACFDVGEVPPLPPGPFDVVLLLETMLAFPDKRALLEEVSAALRPGGRFGFTLEEGLPLSEAESEGMPGADTVWLTPLVRLRADLGRAGMRVRWCQETSRAHRVTVDALVDAYAAAAPELREAGAGAAVDGLIASHRLWSRWLREGRVRKFDVVAEKVGP